MSNTRKARRTSAVGAAVSRSSGTKTSGGDGAASTGTPNSTDALLDSVAAPTAQDVQQAQEEASASIDLLPRYPLVKMAPHPFNPKARLVLDDDLIDLGHKISTYGLHQPIVLAERWIVERDDPKAAAALPDDVEWVIIAGHRRYRASEHAGLTELPGLLRTSPCTPAETTGIFNDENGDRKDPSPLMYAEVWHRMRQDAEMTTTQIAERVGVGQPTVSKTLKLRPLIDWDEAAQEMHTGRLTRDDGYTLLDLPKEDQSAVFAGWKHDQDNSDNPSPLRVHARRYANARASAATADEAVQPAKQSKTKPKTGRATATPQSASSTEADQVEPVDEPSSAVTRGRETQDIAAAVIAAKPSATVRGDILVDAALYVDESTADPIEWRSIARQVLGTKVPERGALDHYARKTRRDVALARAVVLLEEDGRKHTTPPPHITRHQERLRELGVL